MTTRIPNGFPREGDHNPVTARRISELEQYRSDLNHYREYTLGTDAQTRIRAAQDAARFYSVSRGCRILQEASDNIRSEHRRVVRPGLVEQAQNSVPSQSLDMKQIKQAAKEHLRKQFQNQTQSMSP